MTLTDEARQALDRQRTVDITTIGQIRSQSIADRRFYTTTTAAFAALALILTAAGLVIVIARAVVERRREIAIRTSLGARAGELIALRDRDIERRAV